MILKAEKANKRKACPDGADCPYKAVKARKTIRSMPDQLKGQEGANIKPSEQELLYRYERTGLTPEQLEDLLERLRGECWLCEYGKPYDLSSLRKLHICELGYPDRKEDNSRTIAQARDKSCRYWKLKQDLKGSVTNG